MKILVRIMAETGDDPAQNKDLIGIENVFTKHIAEAIVHQLWARSPVDRRKVPAPVGKTSVWSEGRMKKNEHLYQSWKIASGTMGSKSIYNKLPYAYYLAKGTGVYGPKGQPIVPREKKMLSFYYSFIRKWVVTRQVQGINPARFKKVLDESQKAGTIIGVRKAIADQEMRWRGKLQAKLTVL